MILLLRLMRLWVFRVPWIPPGQDVPKYRRLDELLWDGCKGVRMGGGYAHLKSEYGWFWGGFWVCEGGVEAAGGCGGLGRGVRCLGGRLDLLSGD